MRQPRGFQFATGQGLPKFVVDFARDAGPLLLADVLKINGQRAELLVGLAQFALPRARRSCRSWASRNGAVTRPGQGA